MDDRGRLTVPDVVYVAASLAFLGALYPVYSDSLSANIGLIDPRTAYLLQLVLPLFVLVLLYLIVVVGIRGAGG